MLMGFNHLNTIEEEKHETQNSNYFREGGESERDVSSSHVFAKGSRILDDLDQSGSSPEQPLKAKAAELQVQEEDEEEYEEDDDDKDEVVDTENPRIETEKDEKSINEMKSVGSQDVNDEEEYMDENYDD